MLLLLKKEAAKSNIAKLSLVIIKKVKSTKFIQFYNSMYKGNNIRLVRLKEK